MSRLRASRSRRSTSTPQACAPKSGARVSTNSSRPRPNPSLPPRDETESLRAGKRSEARRSKMIAGEIRTAQTMSAVSVPSKSRVNKIAVIALNTFRESIRDRVLYNLILFVLLLVCASVFISELSINQETKFIATLGLSAMLVFGAIIAIFIGVGLVYKEIDKRTIYNLLSKPVHRHEFIIGKYFGLCMTL